jgi:hypothetical protein
MAHRVGVCGSCRARFQIPATFLPKQARCRTCGGVVEIGPPEKDSEVRPEPARAEPPATAAPAAPAPIAAKVPAPAPEPVKKRSLLVPALVAAGVLALLVFGAFQLFGKSDRPSTAQAPAPPAGDHSHAGEPKPDEAPAPR